MKGIVLIAVLAITGISSCKKETVDINTSFVDTVSVHRYYANDVVSSIHSGLYNKWKLTHVTGGFAGGEHDLIFDYLIFKQNGIYCIVDNDSVKEFGKINVKEQYKEWILVEFQPDPLSKTFVGDFQKYVDLTHKDTLILHAPCCDRFSFELTKQK